MTRATFAYRLKQLAFALAVAGLVLAVEIVSALIGRSW